MDQPFHTRADVLKALNRAYRDDIFRLFTAIEDGPDGPTATYWSLSGARYRVTVGRCTCPALRLCKHRVALAELTGTMDRLVPGWYDTPGTHQQAA